MSGRTVYSVGEALGLRALVDRDLACKVCGYTMQRHVHGHSCAMFVTDAATTPELTALRSQVSELRADLEVAVAALRTIGDDDALDPWGIARATLNSIRKDG